jgi:hypothetical protein
MGGAAFGALKIRSVGTATALTEVRKLERRLIELSSMLGYLTLITK